MEVKEQEVWKPISKFDGYEVSTHGRLKSSATDSRKEKILKQFLAPSEYLYCILLKNGREYLRYVHLTVAEAFLDFDYKINYKGY